MQKQCCECKKKREAFCPVLQKEDGTVLWVCKDCWDLFDYSVNLPKP